MRQQAATPQNDKTRNKNPNQDRECALRKNSKVLPLYSQGGMGYTNLVHSKKKKKWKNMVASMHFVSSINIIDILKCSSSQPIQSVFKCIFRK